MLGRYNLVAQLDVNYNGISVSSFIVVIDTVIAMIQSALSEKIFEWWISWKWSQNGTCWSDSKKLSGASCVRSEQGLIET